ncbi:MAG TPA: hypothetical protein PLW97_07080, partial [Synergistaceae bacterium]|nr:hypothetical protein [Synergistaceae bacterium]
SRNFPEPVLSGANFPYFGNIPKEKENSSEEFPFSMFPKYFCAFPNADFPAMLGKFITFRKGRHIL